MNTQIEIYQVRGGNMHVVLRGRAGEGAGPDDPDVFARYLEACQAFSPGLAPLPDAITSAFDEEGESHGTPAPTR
jgi:hypothetical protein